MLLSISHAFTFRTGGEWLVTNMRRGESLFELEHDCVVRSTKAWTDGWMNGWMNEWMNNRWMSSIDGWRDNRQINGCMMDG